MFKVYFHFLSIHPQKGHDLRFNFCFQHSRWPMSEAFMIISNINDVFDLINLKQTMVWQRHPGEILPAAVTSLPLHGKCFIRVVTVCVTVTESVSLSLFVPQKAWWGWQSRWSGVWGKGAVNNIRPPPSLSRQRWRQASVGIATMAQTHKRWKSINLYLYQNHTETLVATPHCGSLCPPNLHLINSPIPPSLPDCSTSDTANNATQGLVGEWNAAYTGTTVHRKSFDIARLVATHVET